MVSKQVVTLVCDICKSEGDGVTTHRVLLDKRLVDVELCGKDFTKVEKYLGPIITAGRKVSGTQRRLAAV